MKLYINGDSYIFEKTPLTIQDVMEDRDAYKRSAAVALNNQFVPKIRHAEIVLKENDRLEILEAMQGG